MHLCCQLIKEINRLKEPQKFTSISVSSIYKWTSSIRKISIYCHWLKKMFSLFSTFPVPLPLVCVIHKNFFFIIIITVHRQNENGGLQLYRLYNVRHYRSLFIYTYAFLIFQDLCQSCITTTPPHTHTHTPPSCSI